MHDIVTNNIDSFDGNSDEIVRISLADTIKKHQQGSTIMLELPIENYFTANTTSVKFLLEQGFEGVYVSFQRPYENIACLLKEQGIDTDSLVIIDCTTKDSGEICKEKSGCVNISASIDVDEFKKIILNSLKSLKSKNRFVLIDSLTTLALYKSTSDITKLSGEIMDIIKNDDFGNVVVLFNVAKDLSKKKYIRDITTNVDKVINFLNKSGKYSREVINQDLCT